MCMIHFAKPVMESTLLIWTKGDPQRLVVMFSGCSATGGCFWFIRLCVLADICQNRLPSAKYKGRFLFALRLLRSLSLSPGSACGICLSTETPSHQAPLPVCALVPPGKQGPACPIWQCLGCSYQVCKELPSSAGLQAAGLCCHAAPAHGENPLGHFGPKC